MIRFNCPWCGKALQVNDSLTGKTGKCSGCGQQCTIPALASPEAPPIIEAPPFFRPTRVRSSKRSRPAATMAVDAIVLLVICLGLIAVFWPAARLSAVSAIIAATGMALVILIMVGKNKLKSMPQDWGPVNPAMICPHCQIKGQVRAKGVVRKRGVSGGKVTAAIFTGGLSLLFTGLSQEVNQTQAHCCECGNTWEF